MPPSLIEQLTYSTARIECTLNDGSSSFGTGFFVDFFRNGNVSFPVLVSNKHVIAGATSGRIHLTFIKENGEPDVGNYFPVEIGPNFEQMWIQHPDPQIDLAILPVASVITPVTQQLGRQFYYMNLGTDMIATSADRESLSAMENVIMIGYPNGLWDDVNNMPIIRKGITATHTKHKWRGRDEFLTDIASFPGSSGSPVMLADVGSYPNPHGGMVIKNRFMLLGIHRAGFMHRADGEIVFIPTPTTNRPVPVIGMPNNLGVAIDSQRILDFEPILRAL